MSNINELILEQVQKPTFLDQKIQNIQQQNKHLSQLLPLHKNNINNNSNNKQEKKEPPKIFELPTRKEIKMSRNIGKMAYKLLDLRKELI